MHAGQGKGGAVKPACGVTLVLGQRPLYRATVYGEWRGVGRTRYAPLAGHTLPPALRQHAPSPALNALVRANGTLRLAS